jgi:anaerobic selenocysteine-containing dehydrogenase
MEQRIPGYCALCISRCGCISVVEDGILRSVEPLPGHPTGQSLCIKGKAAPELVYSPQRILRPLKRTTAKGSADPLWKTISWEEALETIAARLKEIEKESGPEAVTFGVTTPSGTGIADSFVWVNRLAHAFGSPNTLFATENCNWHKDFASAYTHGDSIGMPDYERSGCIVLWGFNPAVSWLAQARSVIQAARRGAKLIVVDPRKAGLARRADEWLRVRPGADGPLAMALAHQWIENGWYDEAFIRQWSNGPLLVREDTGELLTSAALDPAAASASASASKKYLAWDLGHGGLVTYDPIEGQYARENLEPALLGKFDIETEAGSVTCRTAFQIYADECGRYAPARAEKITGVAAQQIIDTARLLHESGPVSYFSWTGTAQQSQATQTGRAIALFYSLTGQIDAPGGNVYFTKPPITNVLGMDLLTAEQRAKTLGLDQRPLGPGTKAWITSHDLNKSIVEGTPYRTRALIGFGGNPLLTKPNSDGAADALSQLEFFVHADLFHNPTSNHADILLPVASPWERSGLNVGFQISQQAESLIQLRGAAIAPRGESRSDQSIVFELAKRLGLGEHFFEGDLDAALQHLIEPTGLTMAELKSHPEGISISLATHYRKYRRQGFATPSKKLEIYSERFHANGYAAVPRFQDEELDDLRYPLRLTSAKWVFYCHSQQRQLPSLRNRMPDPLVELHPRTAAMRGIQEGDWVSIETSEGSIQARAKLVRTLAEDVVCSQYGWWKESGGSYNDLISESDFDPISSSNTLRRSRCNIARMTQER